MSSTDTAAAPRRRGARGRTWGPARRWAGGRGRWRSRGERGGEEDGMRDRAGGQGRNLVAPTVDEKRCESVVYAVLSMSSARPSPTPFVPAKERFIPRGLKAARVLHKPRSRARHPHRVP